MLVVFYCEGLGAFSFLHVGIPLGLGNYTSVSKSDVERTRDGHQLPCPRGGQLWDISHVSLQWIPVGLSPLPTEVTCLSMHSELASLPPVSSFSTLALVFSEAIFPKKSLVFKSWLPWWMSGKEPTRQCRRCGFDPWFVKMPWRRTSQLTPVFLPGESPGTEEPGGLQSMWSQRS